MSVQNVVFLNYNI